MGDAVGDDFDSETLSIADRLISGLTVTHYARKLESFGDPTAIFLAV